MKRYKEIHLILFTFLAFATSAQQLTFENDISPKNPYGKAHPLAPPEVKDFEGLIGECHCKSVSRISQTEWADTTRMIWKWKYIMDGMGVQDETLKSDGKHSGSIRQFIADSSRWYVHYYSSNGPTTTLPVWEGNKNDEGEIVLYREQNAPNGMEGYYRLTFSNITVLGYDWIGEWVDKAEKIVYPTWKIFCRKAHAD